MSKARTITKQDYYKAIGLLHLAQEYEKKVEEVIVTLAELLNEPADDNYYGHVTDAVYSEYTIKELLNKLEIKVTK